MSTTDTLAAAAESKPPAKEAKKAAGTEYVVLRMTDDPNDTWKTGSSVHATSASDAVRKAAAGKEGVYVAVPARSFQPQRVKVETTTHLRLEDA